MFYQLQSRSLAFLELLNNQLYLNDLVLNEQHYDILGSETTMRKWTETIKLVPASEAMKQKYIRS